MTAAVGQRALRSLEVAAPDHAAAHVGSPGRFSCACSATGSGLASVRARGELDCQTAPRLEQALRQARSFAHTVVLDLRGLDFMDCAGMHTVLDANESAQRAGRQLVVVRGTSCVDRVFTLTGTCDLLEMVDLGPGEPPVQALLKLHADVSAA